MSDPHRLRSQSLVISSDKTLAARAALAHLGRVNEAQAVKSWACTQSVLHDDAAARWHDARMAQRGRISEGMRKAGVPDG